MFLRAVHTRTQAVAICALLLGVMSILTWGTVAWGSTRFGQDIEVQAWFRMRHTFQTDGKEHFDWVQWRNEAFVWLIYNNIVKNGTLRPFNLDWRIPFVENLAISARYRARVDPVYYLREHYYDLYDSELRSNWFNPERDFRDLYADIDHGEIGPGRLSTRWGYQQIVWGESDLFRSLDIINPLRTDQNFAVGEKFDEFRFPLLAVKSFYDLGTVGEWLSNVGIEAYYTPRWFSGSKHLLLENGWRIPYQVKGCLGPNGEVLDYSPENCANSRRFLPYRPQWLSYRRMSHPWSIFRVGPVGTIESPDFACANLRCAPDVAGDRISVIYNILKGRGSHHTRGTGKHHSAGVRLVGTTWFGLQFSLNYIYIPSGPWGDSSEFPHKPPTLVYGDFAYNGIQPSGSFEEGLRQCLSESGKSNTRKTRRPSGTIALTGADLYGYDWPARRLDARGNPLPSATQPQAARQPITICASPKHTYRHTHVLGFTATYNDFDYTGAVWRLEQSISTEEYMNRYPVGYGIHGTTTRPGRTLFHPQMMWRSMVGFDLFSSLSSYPGMGWTRNLPGDFGTQASFLSFQWLMQYKPAVSNTFCTWNNAVGTGPSEPGQEPSRKAFSGCREHHWNHILTLGFSGQGYFKSKLEQRLAIAFEPRGQQYLLFGQWWWRNFYSLPVDLSMGTAWYPGSRFDNSWSLLNYFTNRNLLWFEATYYLL